MRALRRGRVAGRGSDTGPRGDPRKFLQRNDGAALVEFAFAAPILLTALIGIVEVSMVIFLNLMVESGVREAARFGLTGSEQAGYTREEYIVEIVNDRTMGLLEITDANVTMQVYDSFADVSEAEPYVDTDLSGSYDVGEPFTDVNGNGTHDDDQGVPGAGASQEIVLYQVTAEWTIFTSYLAGILGADGLFTISSSIVVRNEPWDVGT